MKKKFKLNINACRNACIRNFKYKSTGVFFSFRLSHALMTWGDKFTQKEVNEAMDACDVDDNGELILITYLLTL